MKKIKKREKMKKELAQKKGAANLQRQLLKNSEKGEFVVKLQGAYLGQAHWTFLFPLLDDVDNDFQEVPQKIPNKQQKQNKKKQQQIQVVNSDSDSDEDEDDDDDDEEEEANGTQEEGVEDDEDGSGKYDDGCYYGFQ